MNDAGGAGADRVRIERAIRSGDVDALEAESRKTATFPRGMADAFEHWITVAAGIGTVESIEWMIAKGASPDVCDPTGYTPLHSAIENETPDKYAIIRCLISAGCNLDAHGFNDWTPLHLAAMRDDASALTILLDAGAKRSVRTRIDECATAEQEARALGHLKMADLIRDYRG